MTARPAADRRPPACHYDRGLRQRVTRQHSADCPTHNDGTCPATDRGCQPCEAPHCLICGREHATPARPDTCTDCEAKVAADLTDIAAAYDALGDDALDAGGDGRLAAAAPIPGGDAQVLRGLTVPIPAVRTSRTLRDDHRVKDGKSKDPMPPLAVLAQWEDIYRSWLAHTQHQPIQAGVVDWYGGIEPIAIHRATVAGAVTYLRDQLPYIANHATSPGAPDFLAFTRQIRTMRADLERRLHDDDTPEQGVACFECGDRLERRIRPRKTCRHSTKAREHLAMRLTLLPVARQLVAELAEARARYLASDRTGPRPDNARYPTSAEYAATLPPSPAELAAARVACAACVKAGGLGGVDDPTAGHSWECPGCRKEYKPGEYVTAVRLDLAADRDGWPNIANAAAAASTLTEWPVGDKTIRGWIGRGWVRSEIQMRPDGLPGVRVVYWPDVRREAKRLAAGMQHCTHLTPARVWLRVLETYPELEVWEDEFDATYEECGACAVEVEDRLARGVRRVVGRRVS